MVGQNFLKMVDRKDSFKGYYHVCTKGDEIPWMFKTDSDFIGGINRIAFCLLSSDIVAIAYILMDTHVHFIFYGTMPDCKSFINKYKMLTGKWISEKHGLPSHLKDLSFSIIEIKSEEDLMETIAYVDRNSVMAGYAHLPSNYPWGSAKYMFDDHKRHQGDFFPISKFTDRQRRKLFSTRHSIPDHWEFDSHNMINPLCFFNPKNGEQIFKTPLRYIYFLSKKVEGRIDIGLTQGRKSFIPDKELRLIAEDICQKLYKDKSLMLLDVNSRLIIAKKLRYDYAATHKQISRIVNIPHDLLKGFV